ncbi:MAG: antiterminator LoaP [Clostridiales bacterium]|nr:antiterminator LoaP [Clostridiales bacterium]
MWCVIQVLTGKEEKIRHACEKYIDSDILDETFIPFRKCRRKRNGVWKDEKTVLFPGYVFLITEHPDELYDQLRRVEGMTKLLRADRTILELTKNEEELLINLGGANHIVEMSYGYIEGQKVTITEGPLKGLEGEIRKIDRHKRSCIVEIDMFGQKTRMTVGLEIVEKK